jgi:hypothetical protein
MSSTEIIARVEELQQLCPNNGLIWELAAAKRHSNREEVGDQLKVMLQRERKEHYNPHYIKKIYSDGTFQDKHRVRVVELFVEVSIKHLPSLIAAPTFAHSHELCIATIRVSQASFLRYFSHMQTEYASETVCTAVNFFDRWLAAHKIDQNQIQPAWVTCVSLALKQHGRTVRVQQFGVRKEVISAMEWSMCATFSWDLTPTTATGFMKHLMLYSAAEPLELRSMMYYAQQLIDFVLINFTTSTFPNSVVAMASILYAHTKAQCHAVARQWFEAVKEVDMHPTEDISVHECCCALHQKMPHHFQTTSFVGIMIGAPKTPVAQKREMALPPVPMSPQNNVASLAVHEQDSSPTPCTSQPRLACSTSVRKPIPVRLRVLPPCATTSSERPQKRQRLGDSIDQGKQREGGSSKSPMFYKTLPKGAAGRRLCGILAPTKCR